MSGLCRDRCGNALTISAIALPILIAFVGLAIDVGTWELTQRDLQGAADKAAFSAAASAMTGSTLAQATTEAKGVMASNGFVNGSNGVTVTVSNPATQGAYATNADAYEVKATKTQVSRFLSIFTSTSAPTVAARAVALKGAPGGGCILSLHATASGATTITNNGAVPNPKCAIYTNSSSSQALKCFNNCTVQSKTFTVGNFYQSDHGYLNGANAVNQAPIADPYADLASTPPSACEATSRVTATASTVHLTPGRYCGGIDFQGSGKTLVMAAGTYFVDTKFNIFNGATLDATAGVTIILVGNYCIGIGDCAIGNGPGNNATINITAPTTGPYAGVAFYSPGTSSKYQEFSNNSYLHIQGAIYAPNQTLAFANNSTMDPALCTQLVASTITINNNGNMNADCGGTGVRAIGSAKPTKLVE